MKRIFRGLRLAFRAETNLYYKAAISLVVLVSSFYFRHWVDVVVIVTVTALALAAETFNTAIEAICDFVEPHQNPKIGAVKDICSGAVGLTTGAWLLVVGYEYYGLIAYCLACLH